jgi:hypothetical protein
MTWAEFMLRRHAYFRMEEQKDLRAREIAWNALIGSHFNPKKLPKTKDKFWRIGAVKKHETNEKMKEAIRRAQEEYLKQLKEKNG